QAEDGIRDKLVTGVQTCALPIYLQGLEATPPFDGGPGLPCARTPAELERALSSWLPDHIPASVDHSRLLADYAGRLDGLCTRRKIGRASCRERVETPD